MFAALLVDEHLRGDLLRLVRVLDEVDLQAVLEEFRHRLLHEAVRDGLFRLVLVTRVLRKAARDKDQAVLHVGERDLALVLLIHALRLEVGVNLAHKRQTHRAVGAAAVLEPRGVVIVFDALRLVGETERGAHLHLIFGAVGRVAARRLGLEKAHGRDALEVCDLLDVIHDAVLIIVFRLLRVALGGLVREHEAHARVDDRLTLDNVVIIRGRNVRISEHFPVRLPADAGSRLFACRRLFFQPADVLALFEFQMVVESVAVDVRDHPLGRILRGAQAEAVKAERVGVVVLVRGILAARVQLAEQKFPVVALLARVVIDRHTAAEVLNFDRAVLELCDQDAVAVAVARLVDRVR